tara:strand:- start:1738 stop:2220 length:483 start_codon:yes stop_codon:yes gene_type:complete
MAIENDFNGTINEKEGLTKASKSYLMETAKWSSSFGILGFIGTGLMVIFSLFAGTMFSAMNNFNPAFEDSAASAGAWFSPMITFVYLLLALLYFFPSLYLFKSGRALKAGLRNDDAHQIEEGFKNLKASFKFWGILSIIFISIYILIFLIGTLAGAAFAG